MADTKRITLSPFQNLVEIHFATSFMLKWHWQIENTAGQGLLATGRYVFRFYSRPKPTEELPHPGIIMEYHWLQDIDNSTGMDVSHQLDLLKRSSQFRMYIFLKTNSGYFEVPPLNTIYMETRKSSTVGDLDKFAQVNEEKNLFSAVSPAQWYYTWFDVVPTFVSEAQKKEGKKATLKLVFADSYYEIASTDYLPGEEEWPLPEGSTF